MTTRGNVRRIWLTRLADAEATGGGFPGWLQRIEGKLRTNATDYLTATDK